jgi:serine/threonine protein kinase
LEGRIKRMSASTSTKSSNKKSGGSADFHVLQVGYNKFFIDRRYKNLRPCGDGSYGFVASGEDTITGEKVAIKKIKDAFSDSVDAKRILRELKLLRHFNSHENIISILDIMTVPVDTPKFDDIYIVTNLMESDLERIIRSRQVLTDQHFQYFLYQILRALKYVHSANVLHRDLKPSNILVNANCDLAICDFGLARGFHVEGQDTLTEYVVTRSVK